MKTYKIKWEITYGGEKEVEAETYDEAVSEVKDEVLDGLAFREGDIDAFNIE